MYPPPSHPHLNTRHSTLHMGIQTLKTDGFGAHRMYVCLFETVGLPVVWGDCHLGPKGGEPLPHRLHLRGGQGGHARRLRTFDHVLPAPRAAAVLLPKEDLREHPRRRRDREFKVVTGNSNPKAIHIWAENQILQWWSGRSRA
eukprot:1186459-Prorocentrum_minimum.AAC.1